ncbi:DUF2478 domain-containing protein [Psychromarinibacter sp. C21-152]|uniref:DUF2478 domain-containing protein n=1 Tax=Psychromarinibacter sediminicola TaxID=3033385 RepID=A0AAE3NVP8_9RHOB|nr:DUF2478 domain-containing protein [Psychromarinibacter sediminicola]MDF0602896.1 DUF2478 domain-containing protein [Psychromarinibacter sediminicola]
MKLAYVTVPGRGKIDDLIAEAVRAFEADGVRLAGTVRAGSVGALAHPCDMELRVLPDGPRFRISQPLGTGAKGCRLDESTIVAIGAAVEPRLGNADLLVVNKFGKLEARGRGLYTAIAAAIEMEIPTLVGVTQMSLPDFNMFSGGMAVPLAPELHAVRDWFESVERPRALDMI